MFSESKSSTAAHIRRLAQRHRVTYASRQRDVLARHITRLAGDDVDLDEIEGLLIALQRSGHLSRAEVVRLQANYLREAKL
jgi:hypothetical protein